MGSMTAFVDELVKLSGKNLAESPIRELAKLVIKHKKPLGYIGAGAAGMHFGKRELDKYLLGRQVYERMHSGG